MFGEWSGEGTLKVKDEEKAFEVKAVRGRKAEALLLGSLRVERPGFCCWGFQRTELMQEPLSLEGSKGMLAQRCSIVFNQKTLKP